VSRYWQNDSTEVTKIVLNKIILNAAKFLPFKGKSHSLSSQAARFFSFAKGIFPLLQRNPAHMTQAIHWNFLFAERHGLPHMFTFESSTYNWNLLRACFWHLTKLHFAIGSAGDLNLCARNPVEPYSLPCYCKVWDLLPIYYWSRMKKFAAPDLWDTFMSLFV
jgi:hypothetical protein